MKSESWRTGKNSSATHSRPTLIPFKVRGASYGRRLKPERRPALNYCLSTTIALFETKNATGVANVCFYC
jgi:hypothetical protein